MSKVLILLASDRVSGPAKGLFQFVQYADRTTWQFLFGFFHLRGSGGLTDCVPVAQALGVPYVILEQSGRFDPLLVRRSYRTVRDHAVTLLQSHGYKGHLICLILRRITGLPWVAFAHGWTDENLRIRCYNRLELQLLRRPDRVVAVSSSVRRRLEAAKVPRSRIALIPNAVEPTIAASGAQLGHFRRSLGIARDTPLLAVIGRLSPEKGQDVLIQACALLARRIPDFAVALVGEGRTEPGLRKLVRSLGLSDRVHFVGHQQDVGLVYCDSDLVVIPSRSEGLPNVLLEAMSQGKVIVATRVGGIPEVIEDGVNGALVPPDHPTDMANAICHLLAQPGQRASIAGSAQRAASRFSPEVRAREIIRLYAALAQQPPAHATPQP